MLDKETQTKILDFVRVKPRTIQEVSQHIDKNWRTAESYIDRIARETGHIATRTFREGTRGALKIVHWNSLDQAKGSAYQERMLHRIMSGKRKEDFSPFDIYQFVDEDKRESYAEKKEFSNNPNVKFDALLLRAKRQILSFSGNLSWIKSGPNMIKTLETLAKRKVSVKILTSIDITSDEAAKQVLAINQRAGWDAIEIRHCEQPLRAVIIDDDLISIKDAFHPDMHREIKQEQFFFYIIKDYVWINWLQKVFWHLWQQSIDAQTRLAALKTITRR